MTRVANSTTMVPAPAAPPGTSPAFAAGAGAALRTSFARRSILALFADGRSRSMVDIYCALEMTSRAVLDAAVAELVAASRLHRTPDQRFSTTHSESVEEPEDDEFEEVIEPPKDRRKPGVKGRLHEGFGQQMTVTEWADHFSRRRETIQRHLKAGKTIEQIAEVIATLNAVTAAHAEASAAGRKTYEGRPCKNCGSTTKRTNNGTCEHCNCAHFRVRWHARKILEART